MGSPFWQVTKDARFQMDSLIHQPESSLSTQDVTNNVLVAVVDLLWILSTAGLESYESHAKSFLFKEVLVADFITNLF